METSVYARQKLLEGFFGGLWKKKKEAAEQEQGDPGDVVGVQSGAQKNEALQDDGERDECELGRPASEIDTAESKQREKGGGGIQQSCEW